MNPPKAKSAKAAKPSKKDVEESQEENAEGEKKTITCTCVNSIYEGGKRYSAGDAIELTPSRLESLGDVVKEGAPAGKQVESGSMRNKQVDSPDNDK